MALAAPAICRPVTLPPEVHMAAAATAVRENPANAPLFAAAGDLPPLSPAHIAVLTGRYWSDPVRLTVAFLDNPDAATRRLILAHMNAWREFADVEFSETADTTSADVRIARGADGFWSYLGTDIKHIPRDRPTMNLAGFTARTPESEYRRVVRHETGHTLGCPHEHMRRELIARLDPPKVYEFFGRTQGWSRAVVDQQILTPVEEATIRGTATDETSIMCYQFDGSITVDGRPIVGGLDFSVSDREFAAQLWPRRGPEGPPPPPTDGGDGGGVVDESLTALVPGGSVSVPWRLSRPVRLSVTLPKPTGVGLRLGAGGRPDRVTVDVIPAVNGKPTRLLQYVEKDGTVYVPFRVKGGEYEVVLTPVPSPDRGDLAVSLVLEPQRTRGRSPQVPVAPPDPDAGP